jgi:hypothetical protein
MNSLRKLQKPVAWIVAISLVAMAGAGLFQSLAA